MQSFIAGERYSGVYSGISPKYLWNFPLFLMSRVNDMFEGSLLATDAVYSTERFNNMSRGMEVRILTLMCVFCCAHIARKVDKCVENNHLSLLSKD